MYLSRLILNPRARQVQAELGDRYQLHRTLASGFTEEAYKAERLLYRLEVRQKAPYLQVLMQSETLPQWSELAGKDYLLEPVQTRQFDLRVSPGDRFVYRLVANPTRRLRAGEQMGKRVPLYKYEGQSGWMQRKALEGGFQLHTLHVTNLTDEYAYKVIGGVNRRITHHGVKFEGILSVLDAALFERCIRQGIGSAKGFGFGLLSIARM